MNNLEKFKDLIHGYGLDERETKIDDNSMCWFTNRFFTVLFDVNQSTIDRNINELLKVGEIDQNSNMQKCILVGSDKPVNFYDINVLYSLGMWLRSPRALEFRNHIKELLEGLRKGDLKITSTKSFFEIVGNKKPTVNHLKNRDLWLNEGKSTPQLQQRSLSIFINLGRNEYLSELEIASPNLCSKISDVFNIHITGHTAKELREIRKVPHNRLLRDYLTDVELKAMISAETIFSFLMEKERYVPRYVKVIELAEIAASQAHREAVSMSKLLGKIYHDYTVQIDLLEAIGC
ncbi:hypothetical protein [Methanobrevibacter arboriphilus]|uniref:Uncharacterized protein n=1 Tax=Methanobrevibacter arboriphilus TaxID=39441 RepID=A0ACA8R2N5_METAZ|nr:hypothetical protein [Methanobrevibacter arboriphilus]BBL61504.1 hypothetical protein MarbSA_05440 [Methanobrevibacter arboriphilus]